MLELPEALVLARQIQQTLAGKTILRAIADQSPHKFAWYHGDPAGYHQLLAGKVIDSAESYGGLVEVRLGNVRLVFGDGVALNYSEPGGKIPDKHQLLLEFTDGSCLSGSVRMYGGLWCFKEGDFHNSYYHIAREKVSPLDNAFDFQHFSTLAAEFPKLSVKAFLATEQRIPGLGNGVLQDILFKSRIHPKRKMLTLSQAELKALYVSIKTTLRQMADQGGRNTEKDIFGHPGGYQTILSKDTVHYPCPVCGKAIKKESYMGGSIYYCSGCQQV